MKIGRTRGVAASFDAPPLRKLVELGIVFDLCSYTLIEAYEHNILLIFDLHKVSIQFSQC